MKSIMCLVFFTLLTLALSDPIVLYPRGCIYILGRCHRECEEGTRSYTTGCGYLTPEPTCDRPNPEPDTSGRICDYSACYCEPPTVRDTITKKCVPLEECTKKESIPGN